LGTEKHAYLAAQLAYLRDNGALPPRDEAADFFDAGCRRVAERVRDSLIANNVQPSAMHIEERCTMEDGTYGTADLWYCNEETGRLFVWDFKTFRNPGRDYTAQLAGYALAINQTRELAGKQPLHETNLRVAYGDSAEVDCVMLSLAELQDITAEVIAAFDKGERGEAQACQCNWCELCANFTSCQACISVIEQARDTLADAPTNFAAYTPEKRARVLVVAKFAEKWATATIKAAKAVANARGEICDESIGERWGLKHERGKLVIDPKIACRELRARGVKDEAISCEFELSVDGFKRAAKSVGLNGKACDALMEKCGTRSEDVVKLVRK
jgi:hypothetical protein